MKAVVYERYGPPEVLRFAEVATPVPKPDELLIRARATTVTAADWRVRSLTVPRGFGPMARLALGVRGPRQAILGTEVAGEIVAVGSAVRSFAVGDSVFAFRGARMGCHAEYVTMAAGDSVARVPAGLDWGEAAALSFGGTTALHFLRRAALAPGERVLVNGASGGVGMAAVQIARHFGAQVTGVCSAANADVVRSLGAHRVIDYAREDFTRDGAAYDVIVDTAGTAPWSRSRTALRPGGRLLMVLGSFAGTLQAPWIGMTGSRRIVAGTAGAGADDLRFLARLAESGEYRPVIDRRYAFADIVEAHRYVDTGRKRGNVVITMLEAER